MSEIKFDGPAPSQLSAVRRPVSPH